MSDPQHTGLIFDLDGTLIDSAPALQNLCNQLLEERRLTPLTLAEARSYIGSGPGKLVERTMHARDIDDEAEISEAIIRFAELYENGDPHDNRPFAGVDATLGHLQQQGYALAICTNKPGIPTRAVLDAMGWSELFTVIVAGDSLQKSKPDPAPLYHADRLLDRKVDLFIGDSDVDAETAKRANFPFLLYTEGYRRSPVESLPARSTFSDFTQLAALIETVSSDIRPDSQPFASHPT